MEVKIGFGNRGVVSSAGVPYVLCSIVDTNLYFRPRIYTTIDRKKPQGLINPSIFPPYMCGSSSTVISTFDHHPDERTEA